MSFGDTFNGNYPTRVLKTIARVDFDPTNPAHRSAAVKFFREGTWEIKFKSQWPCTNVPQTVLMKLAEYACQAEVVNAVNENKYVPFDPFNLHTFRPFEQEMA